MTDSVEKLAIKQCTEIKVMEGTGNGILTAGAGALVGSVKGGVLGAAVGAIAGGIGYAVVEGESYSSMAGKCVEKVAKLKDRNPDAPVQAKNKKTP